MADIKIFRVRHMLPVAAVAMAMLSSCSLLGSKSGGEGGGLLGGGGGKVKTDAVLPQDREKIHENASAKAYTSEELGRGVVKGDWAIEKVMGQTAVGETAPFLKFVPSEKLRLHKLCVQELRHHAEPHLARTVSAGRKSVGQQSPPRRPPLLLMPHIGPRSGGPRGNRCLR